MMLGLPVWVWIMGGVAAFSLAFLCFTAWQLAESERKLRVAQHRWEHNGRVITSDDGTGRRVIVGETCGAPSEPIAAWIVARHDYELLPWYRRMVTQGPRLPADA